MGTRVYSDHIGEGEVSKIISISEFEVENKDGNTYECIMLNPYDPKLGARRGLVVLKGLEEELVYGLDKDPFNTPAFRWLAGSQ